MLLIYGANLADDPVLKSADETQDSHRHADGPDAKKETPVIQPTFGCLATDDPSKLDSNDITHTQRVPKQRQLTKLVVTQEFAQTPLSEGSKTEVHGTLEQNHHSSL